MTSMRWIGWALFASLTLSGWARAEGDAPILHGTAAETPAPEPETFNRLWCELQLPSFIGGFAYEHGFSPHWSLLVSLGVDASHSWGQVGVMDSDTVAISLGGQARFRPVWGTFVGLGVEASTTLFSTVYTQTTVAPEAVVGWGHAFSSGLALEAWIGPQLRFQESGSNGSTNHEVALALAGNLGVGYSF